MDVLSFLNTFQHGPNGGFPTLPSWWWIVLLMPSILVVIFLYRFLFPQLNRVTITEHFETAVEEKTKATSTINADASDDLDGKRGHPLESSTASIDVALRLLEPDERKVVEALMAADGSLLQKEISWKTGFTRVKTHRVLVRLIRRGVVTSEKYYNTNKITLAEWLR
jgi:hypothetical protein